MSFTYDDTNRLSQMVKGTVTANYQYDGKGQRVVKTVDGVSTYFIFDIDGQLIAEADATGVVQKDYIYFGSQPLAMATTGINAEVYYYHVDHLSTPQALTNQAQAIVWQADYEAFGEVGITSNLVENNLRFPGQYYDAESGLYYNYFRYYDAGSGRYITSDPIGLAGGINTYGYVGGNPLNRIDPYGLYEAVLPRTTFPSFPSTAIPRPSVGAVVNPVTVGIAIALWPNAVGEGSTCDGGGCTSLPATVNAVNPSDNVIPFPGAHTPPEQCDDDEKDKGCEALRASMLSSCASLKGTARMKCIFSAEDAYNQCKNEK